MEPTKDHLIRAMDELPHDSNDKEIYLRAVEIAEGELDRADIAMDTAKGN